jgi:NAD(P)-dependent dehydrogenase (short-subunit alcohol dehydrogenase family)
MELAGKAALVTGSTRGIGRAIAEALADAGAGVAVNARTRRDVEATVSALRAGARGTVVGIVADVGRPDDCTRLVTEAAAALGRLDILVNNAGFGILKSIEELTWDEWRGQIDVNLGGVWGCTKAALPYLKEAGRADGAWVINIGSLAGRNTFAGGSAYNASKFGLVGMTEAIMLDLRPQGIRVSIVMPGSVNTAFDNREAEPGRGWRLEPSDVALAVMQLLAYPREAHVSRIEMRPAMPEGSQRRR